ncbi:DUF1772 domain-containing protein [Afipia sp. P52-10]|uniref:anthrone oxygenase family protein n=1 Tax=Afipia sp. P52-10 TaxID=1429916 RepID=UPI0004B21DA3|nr:anthrone oxygenase family protein [Afipia sp. P52-10]
MTKRSVRLTCLAISILAAALISGFFYAYSCSVMPGLAATDPESAIRAMQGINAIVRNGTFAFAFFGTLAFGGISVILLIGNGGRPLAFALIGTLIYGVGVLMVTLLYSMPLNEALASAAPTPETAARIWNDYLEPWAFWNTLRMLTSVLALAAFVTSYISLLLQPYTAARQIPRMTTQTA